MQLILRPYQHDSINLVQSIFRSGIKRVVLCLPTGSGKTIVFSQIAKFAQSKNKRVLILAHRKELLKQANKTNNCDITMVETLNNQIKKGFNINSYDLVIVDEAHIGNFKKVLTGYDNFLIGATATPISKPPLSLIYNDIVCNVDIPKLIEQGYLSKPKTYLKTAVDISKLEIKLGEFTNQSLSDNYDKPKVYEGLVNDYIEKFIGKKAIVFCCNIQHSKNVTNEFIKQGIKAIHIDSEMPDKERDLNIQIFTQLDNAVLCNCSIATTGFDVPNIEIVIVNRATKSISLWLQMCGRGSRITETKKRFTILDYGENIIRHGHWEADRDWKKLFFAKEKTKKEQAAPVKECPDCKAIVYASAKICQYCEHIFDVKTIVIPPGELKEVEYKKFQTDLAGKYIYDLNLNELMLLKKVKNYKQTFIESIMFASNKDILFDFWKQKGYADKYKNMRLELFNSRALVKNFIVKI